MKFDNLKILLILGTLLFIVLLYLNKCSKDKNSNKELTSLINALNDSLRHYKNKDGENVATIAVLKTEKINDFLSLQTKDIEVRDLQDRVKQYKSKLDAGGSVTNATIETNINHSGVTTITKTDTIRKDNLVYIYPTYSDSIVNKWITYRATMNKDTSTEEIKVINDFSIIVGRTKGKDFADLITQNPYSSVSKMRVYQVSVPKPKKFGIGPNVSYSIGSDFKPQVTIGIGLQYNFIRL